MKNPVPRWLPWVSIAALLVLLLCHEWFGPDIWYHLYLGERIVHTGNPQPPDNLILQQPGYVNLYWLFQLLVRGVFAVGGIYAVSMLFIALWGIALGFWLRTTGALRAGAWGPPLALAAVLLCQTRFEQRPEVLSFVFLAMQVWWLASWKNDEPLDKSGTGFSPCSLRTWAESPCYFRCWEYAWFVLVQVLWTNVHGYFIFGPALVGLKLGCVAVQNMERADSASLKRARKASCPTLLLLVLTLLATLASPFGTRNWVAVLEFARVLRQMRFSIQEALPLSWVPAQVWSVDVFWVYWAALLASAVFVLFTAARKELFALALAAVGLGLSTVAFRNIPMLVFFGAPLLGVVLGGGETKRSRVPLHPINRTNPVAERVSVSSFGTMAVSLLALGLSVWVVTGGFYRSMGTSFGFGIRESKAAYPVEFSAYLRADPFKGSIFNSPEDGGYLEFHFPELRLYADSRVIDVPLIRNYFSALHSPARFRDLQARQAFDGVLLTYTESRDVIADLRRDPDWRLAYSDRYRAFFVKSEK